MAGGLPAPPAQLVPLFLPIAGSLCCPDLLLRELVRVPGCPGKVKLTSSGRYNCCVD